MKAISFRRFREACKFLDRAESGVSNSRDDCRYSGIHDNDDFVDKPIEVRRRRWYGHCKEADCPVYKKCKEARP